MGLFDEIVCDLELPGTKPDFVRSGHRYQTKDLDCDMSTYRIDETGKLDYEPPFTGIIEFYSSNWAGYGYGAAWTTDGQDIESVDYRATFVDGRVLGIEQTSYEKKACLSSSDVRTIEENAPEVPDRHIEFIQGESNFVGRTLFLQWGGGSDGYHVKVVHQSGSEACLECLDDVDFHHAGKLEIFDLRYESPGNREFGTF